MRRSDFILFGSVILIGFGCEREPKDVAQSTGIASNESLMAFHVEKAREQFDLMDSLAHQWGDARIADSLGFFFIYRDASMTNGVSGKRGAEFYKQSKTVRWNARIMLLDSTICMEWPSSNPLSFNVQSSPWPSGFSELARYLQVGDSVECFLPPHLAWGLTGLPPEVPQDAIIWMQIRVLPADLNDVPLERPWLNLITAFESGDFGPDLNWLENPTLVGHPCLAWVHAQHRSVLREIRPNQPVEVKIQTIRWDVKNGKSAFSAVQTWGYNWGAGGQLIPLLEELVRQEGQFGRWECWCPASVAFGAEGMPSLGFNPEDVVGFHLEIQPEQSASMAQ